MVECILLTQQLLKITLPKQIIIPFDTALTITLRKRRLGKEMKGPNFLTSLLLLLFVSK